MQNLFGSGIFWGTPTGDASGNAISNPSPSQFGVGQDCSIDMSFDTKKLYGQQQFPVAIGRGKGSITGKSKFAQVNGLLVNSMFFGQTLTSGIISDVYDTTGVTVALTVTPTVPNSGTWSADLGVRNSLGQQLTRVASAPATGQYAVAAGVYTFASADVGTTVFINYQYTGTSTLAKSVAINNLPMGYSPTFRFDLYVPFQGKSLIFTFPNCTSSKLTVATKQDDFVIPEFDFDVFANAASLVGTVAFSE